MAFWPTLIVHSPALIVLLPASLTPIINKPVCSGDLIIFMILFISSFEIINVIVEEVKPIGWPHPKIFLWKAVSIADAVTVNPN